MGKIYQSIDGQLEAFLSRQRVFFVATAPFEPDGHVNVSPKGKDAFRVLSPTKVAYVDYNGSGIETVAHLRQNGRIVIMFSAFEGPPNIVRIYGRGRVIDPSDDGFADLLARFSCRYPRAIIEVEVERVADSCGYGVPLFEYRGERDQLDAWADRKGEPGIDRYQREKNALSIDGLPGLPRVTKP